MQYFFSFKMQWVLTSGITFEQYMQLLLNYRKITQDINSMTFEQFLELRWYEHSSMSCFFSPDGQRAVAEGIITLEQYLQIPWSDREDVIIALQDHDTRQRIINGNITIENIIGIGPTHDVATHPINSIQNTSPESVHQSVSESSTQLLNFYESGSEAQQEDIINQQILTRERDILLIQLKLLENKKKEFALIT